MPELPEVETTRRAIAPYLEGRRVVGVVVRTPRLRRPVPADLQAELPGRTIRRVERRGKYLLLRTDRGSAILHLGMSGSLRLVAAATPPGKHDHLDIVLADGLSLRLTDPRRFGLVLWTADDPLKHPLLADLGPEPLGDQFDGGYLFRASRGRARAVKQFIMDGAVVAGVGNIYANDALFRAGIRPDSPAGELSRPRCTRLAAAIREVLAEAIARGDATLDTFLEGHGTAGWFTIKPDVYGREDEPCPRCGAPICSTRQGGRTTYFCRRCQR
ncbi:MAG: bifunctional DNA-formamidopyrimidine glycosylase/DNA-(apurinic or apyrimidinic site) lyase [Geobacteraceae bacterium]|nr:bifunctional DNA-formamidopyrimidine glycosylase/DNA-(apurinic or apyrimidinic site) lyase [Geobacteraceae bacterium]